jgi:hypothetical protein
MMGNLTFDDAIDARSGDTLTVNLARGSLFVETHDESMIAVAAEARGWGAETAVFSLEQRHGGALFGLYFDDDLMSWLIRPKVRVAIRVPREYSLKLITRRGRIEVYDIGGDVEAFTRGGRIRADGIDGWAMLETSGGAIEVDDVTGDLEARTSGGSIDAVGVDGEIEASTSGGAIRVDEVEGPVQLKTSGGKLFAGFLGGPAGRLQTSGGSIKVEYPEGFGVDLDAKASGGKVEIDPAVDVRGKHNANTIKAKLDGGGPRLKLRTSGGRIVLQTVMPD